MSKAVKKKISVELPKAKPRDLSKSRLSVFQRLGTKKLKVAGSLIDTKKIKDVTIAKSTLNLTNKIDHSHESVALDDADQDLLEKKRAEIQKELDLQLKMESNTGGGGGGVVMRKQLAPKEMIRKRKKVRSSSSSSSSSSDSGSSSDSSSSSSSKESRRKTRKIKGGKRRHSSSSSSADVRVKKVTKFKRLIHKKPTDPSKKIVQVKKLQITPGKMNKLSQSPTTTVLRKVPIKVSGTKIQATKKVLLGIPAMSNAEKLAKHQRIKEQQQQQLLLQQQQQQQQQLLQQQQQQQLLLRDKEKERENARIRDIELRERERERMRLKDKERGRSRSPRSPRITRIKSRSPRPRSREIKYRSPPSRRSTSPRALSSQSRSGGNVVRRDRSIDRGYVRKDLYGKHDSRERERRDKERQEREAARDKERREALERCQERQRERERLAKERARREREGVDRLIPRPADRALAIAAARGISRDKSDDRDRQRSHSNGRIGRERIDRDKDHLSYERNYERNEPRVYDSRDRGRIDKDDGRPSREHERDRDYVLVRRRDDRLETRNSPYGGSRDKRGDRDSGGAGRALYVSGSRYEDRIRDDRRIAGPHEYPASRGYIEDRHRTSERDREWIRDNVEGPRRETDRSHIYERSNDRRHIRGEWERTDMPSHPRPNYSDHREWANNGGPGGSGGVLPPGERQWENNGNWQSERDKGENWDAAVYNESSEWPDHHRIEKNIEHPPGLPPGINRRWINWRGGGAPGRGRGGMQHISIEYRRQMPLVQPPHDIIVAGAVAYDEHFKRIVHPAILTPTPVVQPEFTNTSQVSRYQIINKPVEIVTVMPSNIEKENWDDDLPKEPKIENPASPKEPITIITTNTAVSSPINSKPPELVDSVAANTIATTEITSTNIAVSTDIVEDTIDIAPALDDIAPLNTPAIIESIPTSPVVHCVQSTADIIEDVEEQIVPDDLSEISDDADEILNQQEEVKSVDPLNKDRITKLEIPMDDQQNASVTAVTTILPDTGIVIAGSNDNSNSIISTAQTTPIFITSTTGILATPTGIPTATIPTTTITSTPLPTTIEIHSTTTGILTSIPGITTITSQGINKIPVSTTTSIIDQKVYINETKDIPIHDDMELNFEEISDSEFEEEGRMKGLGDALGVDWSSLVAESRAIANEKNTNMDSRTTAKQRWQPHRILLDVGISFKMAGKEFAKQTLADAYNKLKSEMRSDNEYTTSENQLTDKNELTDLKNEKLENDSSIITTTAIMEDKNDIDKKIIKIKEEIIDYDDNCTDNIFDNNNSTTTTSSLLDEKSNIKMQKGEENDLDVIMKTNLHPIACIQVANRLDIEKRKNLILNASGPYSRALSARRDLQLRRQLCGLPIKEINCKIKTGNTTNLLNKSAIITTTTVPAAAAAASSAAATTTTTTTTTTITAASTTSTSNNIISSGTNPTTVRDYASMALQIFKNAIEVVT